jgi:hypothetical protein
MLSIMALLLGSEEGVFTLASGTCISYWGGASGRLTNS